jgi:TonB family protein
MATSSPQDFVRHSPGNDRRKTLRVVRLEKRGAGVSSVLAQDSEQHDRSMTKTPRVASMTPSNDPSAQSVKCAICPANNPPAAKFCNECGSPLSLRVCPQCEAVQARTAKTCIACGFVTVAEDAVPTPKAVAGAAAPPPSPEPVDDDHHPIETAEEDWRALLQEVEDQLLRQVENQSQGEAEEQPERQLKKQAQGQVEEKAHPQAEEGAQRQVKGQIQRPSQHVPIAVVEQDIKHFLWKLTCWSAVLASSGVLVYVLFTLRPSDFTAKSITGDRSGIAAEPIAGVRLRAEGKIIRETAEAARAIPAVPAPPSADVDGVRAAPESDSARLTPSRSPTAEAAPSQVRQRLSMVPGRESPKAAVNARPVQAVPPTTAPARVAIAKPPIAKTGHGAGLSANGNRAAEAPLLKPELSRVPTSQPCSATSEMATSCGEKTEAVADAKTNAPQTATLSPVPPQPEPAAKIPAAGADLVTSIPAPGQAAPSAAQPASEPAPAPSATGNHPAQAAPVLAAMAAPTSADAASQPRAGAKILHREDPVFPREAITEGIASGSVKVRLAITANGAVSSVTIVESRPRKVFDKAVIRALKLWRFESTGVPQTVETEVAFSAAN